MAFYSPLEDGSFEVETDDGRKVRTAADEQMLAGMGLEPKPANVQEFDARASQAGPGGMSFDDLDRSGRPSAPVGVPQQAPAPAGTGNSHASPTEAPRYTMPEPIRVAPAQPAASQPQQPSRLDALSDLAASQLVTRSAPRKGAGEVPTSKTVTRAPVASEQDLDSLAEQELGTEAMAVEQAHQQFEQRNQMLEQAIQQNAAREQQLAEQRAKRQAVDAKMVELQTHAEQKEREVAEMQTLSPTDEYFRAAGGPWAKVLAGIWTFLGGLGQAHAAAGGMQVDNQALKAIQSGIKERADMLKQQYDQAKEAGRTTRNAYSDYLQMYGTPEMAMAALQDRGEAIADRKLVIMADKLGNQDALNQAMQWQAQRSEARAMRVAQRNADAAGQQSTTYGYDRGNGGGSVINKDMMRFMLDVEKERGGAGGATVRLPDGSVVKAPLGEGAAKDVQARIVAANSVAESTARIRHLRSQPGAKTDPEKRAQLQTAASQLQLALKRKEALGTLDSGSVDFLNRLTGDPSGIVDFGGADAKLREIEGGAKKELEDIKRFDLGVTQPPASAQSDE